MTSTALPRPADVSSNASPIYVLFDAEVVDELTRDHIIGIASGVLGAVRVRGFGTPDQCGQILRSLDDHPLATYDQRLVYPPVAKLGPAAYDYYGSLALDDHYWAAAAAAKQIRSGMLSGADPLATAVSAIGAAWAGETAPATSAGRPLFAGMIRETTTGMKMHWDEIVRELPGALDDPPIAQLAFNWYLTMPEGGGDTTVYKRRWSPTDEEFRDGYGWREDIVANEPFATIRPNAGDAIVFDPRNYHVVRENRGAGRRVSLSFFLGLTASGRLCYWS